MADYDSYQIPYSILETEQLEHFLEEMAAKGHMLLKIGYNYNGRFQLIVPAKYHFAIRTYGCAITENGEETAEFQKFKRPWEEYGWDYVCSFCSRAIFCCEEEALHEASRSTARPCRPQVGPERRDLYEKAVKAEKIKLFQYVLSCIFMMLVTVSGFLASLWAAGTNRGDERTALFIIVVLAALLLGCPPALELISRHRKAYKLLKQTETVPEFTLFWTEETMYFFAAVLGGTFGAWIGYRELSSRTAFFSIAAAGSAAVTMAVFFHLDYEKNWQKERLKGKRTVRKLVSILPLLLLIPAVAYYPFEKNYRFEDWKHDTVDFYPTDMYEWEIIRCGLGPEELGWGEEGDSFYTDNYNNMVCRSERTIYRRIEGDVTADIRVVAYREQLRYIGTIQAELKKEEALTRYLTQKKLSLEGSIPLDIDGEMKYYLTERKKEIIGTDKEQVVIYFLNLYDERSFAAEDKQLLEEVETLDSIRAQNEGGSR